MKQMAVNTQILRPLIIFLLAVSLSLLLTALKKHPDAQPWVQTRPVAVSVMPITPASHAVKVRGYGTIEPEHRYQMIAQVSGKILPRATPLEIGTQLKEGELMYALDPSQYQYELNQAISTLKQASLELNAVSAMGASNPTRESKKARWQMAQDAKALAELNLSRTRVVAPCNGVVLSEFIADEQVINAGTPLAEFACTDHYQVIVSIPQTVVDYLEDIKTKAMAASVGGVAAQVIRILPELSQDSGLVRVLLQIANPLAQRQTLFLSQFVSAEIVGKQVQDTYLIPQQALHANQTIWIAKPDKTLAIQPVEIINFQDDQALITIKSPIGPIDLITSPIANVREGMSLDIKRIETIG